MHDPKLGPSSQGIPARSFNWKMMESYDPQDIAIQRDATAMSTIMTAIVNFDGRADAQISQNPNILRMWQLTQTIFRYLLRCQNELDLRCREQERELKRATARAKRYKKMAMVGEDRLQRAKEGEKCPVCCRLFESGKFVDKHMKRRHSQMYNAWMAIRMNKVLEFELPSKETKRQIETLRAQLADVQKQQQEMLEKEVMMDAKREVIGYDAGGEQPEEDVPATKDVVEVKTEEEADKVNEQQELVVTDDDKDKDNEDEDEDEDDEYIPVIKQKQGSEPVTDAFVRPEKVRRARPKMSGGVKDRAREFICRSKTMPVGPQDVDLIVDRMTEALRAQLDKNRNCMEGYEMEEEEQKYSEGKESVVSNASTSHGSKSSKAKSKDEEKPKNEHVRKPVPREGAATKKHRRRPSDNESYANHGDSMSLTDSVAESRIGSAYGEYISADEFEPVSDPERGPEPEPGPVVLNAPVTPPTAAPVPEGDDYEYYSDAEDQLPPPAPDDQRRGDNSSQRDEEQSDAHSYHQGSGGESDDNNGYYSDDPLDN